MTAIDLCALSWRKSTASATSECVEVAVHGGTVFVRDSKQRAEAILTFTTSEWAAFISCVKSGQVDVLKILG